MENCAIYTRSSKDRADISPAAQKAELKEFAKNKGYKIAAEFSDAAISANDNPPQLSLMLSELKKPTRGWNVILAVDSSRLARDADLAGVIAYGARKAGVRIEYSKMPSSGNAGMDMIVGAVARAWDHFHSMMSKEKGLAGMKTNVELGYRVGGRPPFGYALEHFSTGTIRQGKPVSKSKLIPDPQWFPRVKQYLKLRIQGVRRVEAARQAGLADKAITSLIAIERNALTYAGCTVWNRCHDRKTNSQERYRPREKWVIQHGTHEAMMDIKEAEALMEQAMPKKHVKRGPSGRFLLSGLLFTPAGEALVSSGDSYYRAGKGKRIPIAALEAAVKDHINEECDSYEFIARVLADMRKAAEAIKTDTSQLRADRKRISAQIANLLRLAEKAPDSPSLISRLKELEDARAEADRAIQHSADNSRLKAAITALTPLQAKELVAKWIEEDGTTIEEQRAALAQIVDRIEFEPNTGDGKVHYRIPVMENRVFNIRTACRELGLTASGVLLASPRGFEPRLPP